MIIGSDSSALEAGNCSAEVTCYFTSDGFEHSRRNEGRTRGDRAIERLWRLGLVESKFVDGELGGRENVFDNIMVRDSPAATNRHAFVIAQCRKPLAFDAIKARRFLASSTWSHERPFDLAVTDPTVHLGCRFGGFGFLARRRGIVINIEIWCHREGELFLGSKFINKGLIS